MDKFTLVIAGWILLVPGLAAAQGVNYGYVHSQVPAGNNPGVEAFYQNLLPYGKWIEHPQYGWVWLPDSVGYNWQPYSDGYWDYTDYGWTWVSDQPWGWIVFHYGRWFRDEKFGWLWYPDTVWAPAWVVWRYSDDVIGWAPLPPGASWDPGSDMDFTYARIGGLLPAGDFCFVEVRNFPRQRVRDHLRKFERDRDFGETRVHTHLRQNGDRIVNELPINRRIEQAMGRSLSPRQSIQVDSPERFRYSQQSEDGPVIIRQRLILPQSGSGKVRRHDRGTGEQRKYRRDSREDDHDRGQDRQRMINRPGEPSDFGTPIEKSLNPPLNRGENPERQERGQRRIREDRDDARQDHQQNKEKYENQAQTEENQEHQR